MTTYSQRFNGNQYTWGKNAVAKNVAEGLKYTGLALGVWNAYSIYRNNTMTATQKAIEKGSNVIYTFGGPVYVTAWTIGWESGKAISHSDWYRENVRPVIQDAMGVDRDEYAKQLRYADIQFEVPKN
jgi:hypothetical protein